MHLMTPWQKERKLELIDRAQGLTKSFRLRAVSFSKKGANKSFSKVTCSDMRKRESQAELTKGDLQEHLQLSEI